MLSFLQIIRTNREVSKTMVQRLLISRINLLRRSLKQLFLNETVWFPAAEKICVSCLPVKLLLLKKIDPFLYRSTFYSLISLRSLCTVYGEKISNLSTTLSVVREVRDCGKLTKILCRTRHLTIVTFVKQ